MIFPERSDECRYRNNAAEPLRKEEQLTGLQLTLPANVYPAFSLPNYCKPRHHLDGCSHLRTHVQCKNQSRFYAPKDCPDSSHNPDTLPCTPLLPWRQLLTHILPSNCSYRSYKPLSSRNETESTYVIIMVALNPSNQTEHRQDLRLNQQRDIKTIGDIIGAEGHTSAGPEQHHGSLKAGSVVSTVVDDDLWDELWVGH